MKKRFTFLYFTAALVAGIIVACSGERAETAKTPDVVAEPGEDTTAREFGYFGVTNKELFTNKLLGAWKRAKKNGKRVNYFTNTYRGTFFLIQNIDNIYAEKDPGLNKKLRFGLIDEKGRQLLPMEYEVIGNPGMILDDYMEVKKNGKYGLFNYADNQLIPAEYDVIYPSHIMEYAAIGQKGNSFFKIYADGKTRPFKKDQAAPNYIRLLKEYRFNAKSEYFGCWISTRPLADFGTDDFYAYASGILFAPSYLARLNVLYGAFNDVNLGWEDYDGDSLDISVKDGRMRGDGVYSMITSYYSYIAESRGYEEEARHLTTLDRRNRIRYSKKVLSYANYDLVNFCSDGPWKPRVRFLNDSLVEVRSYFRGPRDANYDELTDDEEEGQIYTVPSAPVVSDIAFTPQERFPAYENYTRYDYYLINADGSVKELKDGFFPMASAIPLTKEYFTGCFARILAWEEASETAAYREALEEYGADEMSDDPMYEFTNHLALRDLEYMRNEIYARHGMKFKDPKWTAAFRLFKWYKPARSNVSALLTPVEKRNLELIKQVEKELKQNPELVHAEQKYMEFAL